MGNPNFLVVGAQRAGTSFLWGLLDQHPEIFVPKVKEIHYFDDKFRYNLSLEDYQSHFTGINHQSAGKSVV